MEYRITVNNEERYLEVNTKGAATIKGLLSFVGELLEPPYVGLPHNLLVDISELDTSSLDTNDIRNIVAFLEMHKEKLIPNKNAIVAASALAFGFARMYQILSEDVLPMSIRVLCSREEALNWLRDDAERPFER